MLEFKKFKTISFLAESTNFVGSKKGEDIFVGKCRMAEAESSNSAMPSDSGDFGWFVDMQVPTGHEKDGGGESLSEEQKLFLNFKPSFGTCFEKSFEVIVFCNAHADLGGFPLIQS